MWRTYTSLTDVEAVFRSLKSELGLRPIYHHQEQRADGHLFIAVIAKQMEPQIAGLSRHRIGLRQNLHHNLIQVSCDATVETSARSPGGQHPESDRRIREAATSRIRENQRKTGSDCRLWNSGII